MPPHLDLTPTFAHGDMILSSRNSPRLSLRRAGSYNNNDRGPQSSTSSRFSFNHLIASPPPSPGLPALVPRHGKPAPTHKPRRYLKGFCWLLGVVVILYYGFSMLSSGRPPRAVGWATGSGDQYEMVGDSELPDFPTPVVVTDKRGRAKWTVSIPHDYQFPLKPSQYADICHQNMEVSKHVEDLHSHMHRTHSAPFDYSHVDPNFMDVADAETHGILPGHKSKKPMLKGQEGSIVGESSIVESEVCETTLTFVLETSDAGLGKTLMMLWTAYGLAQEQGRDFFVDDSRWAYGKYTNYFQPPPKPKCRPPPRHHMLPCPRHANHIVVSAATVSSTFGGAFNDYFEDPRKMGVYRQEPIFKMARQGYAALFSLNKEDNEYVSKRIDTLRAKTILAPPAEENGMIVGIHIRRGDRHPYEFQYKDSYVPLDRYMDQAREIMQGKFTNSSTGEENMMAEMRTLMVVSSDDPDVYTSEEFSHASPAQEQIKLASKDTLRTAKPLTHNPRKFVEEAVGWEGGFFAGMFWSLGRAANVPITAAEMKTPPSTEALRLRAFVGRAYLMDLAVLGKGSDSVVCTVSAMGCRLLAVMMGWEEAVVKGGWVNVDGKFDWRGVEW